MTKSYGSAVAAFVLIFSIAACSPSPEKAATNNVGADVEAVPTKTTNDSIVSDAENKATTPPKKNVIGLEGLGDLHIGQPVPEGSSWAERGAQTGEACRTVSSPDYPGTYAIVTEGKVRRITIGKRSDVTLVEGVGVGTTEQDVKKWFAGFREEPHKYEEAPAKYLTAPNAASGDPALRFEIGQDGKVSMIHVGTMPELALVEGCA